MDTPNGEAPARPPRPQGRVLLVEDDTGLRAMLVDAFSLTGIVCAQAGSLQDARKALEAEAFDVVIIDQGLPDGDGIDLVRELAPQELAPQVIVIAGLSNIPTAVEAMRLGAIDYLAKPFEIQEMLTRVERALERATLRRRDALVRSSSQRGRPLRGPCRSAAMQETWRLIEVYAAAAPVSVLITGETGVGKERVARSLHEKSPRAGQPLVAANCAGFEGALLESEIFGHEKGSFTGAHAQKPGLLELADGGTLFLDEVGEMPLSAQAKLLRALEERSFRRVGGAREIRSDFWLLSATNRDPRQSMAEGKMREDLYYRLSTLMLRVPPLRERIEDIPDIIGNICEDLLGKNAEHVRPAPGVLEAFQAYNWPGNVRELRNVIERALILNKDQVIHIPRGFGGGPESAPGGPPVPLDPEQVRPLKDTEREARRRAIERALAAYGGNKTAAARALDVSLSTLKRLLKEHGIDNLHTRPVRI